MASVGPLVPADEMLVHQIADTFATVSQSDRSWTEKIWAMAADRAGSMQLVFGLGVYPNRGVVDAFGGVSRGVEQWTVRASGRLGRDPGAGSVGPLRYEIVEPLKKIRFSLEDNPVIPVTFDWLFDGVGPSGTRTPRAAPRRVGAPCRRRCRALPPGRHGERLGGSGGIARGGRSLSMGECPRPQLGGPLRGGLSRRGRRARARPERGLLSRDVVPCSLRVR